MTALDLAVAGKATRKRPKPGDIFEIRLVDGTSVFGRVIANDAYGTWAVPNCVLIYVFKSRLAHGELPSMEHLSPKSLLIDPVMVTDEPWNRGYFRTIASAPLEPGEVLERHCFRHSSGQYVDEYANERKRPSKPCGQWGVHSAAAVIARMAPVLRLGDGDDGNLGIRFVRERLGARLGRGRR